MPTKEVPPHQFGRMTYGRAIEGACSWREAHAAVSHGLTSSPPRGEGTSSAWWENKRGRPIEGRIRGGPDAQEDSDRSRCRRRTVCGRGRAAAVGVPHLALGHGRRPGAGRVRAGERLPQLGGVVALGQARSRRQIHLRGPVGRSGCRLRLVRQRQDRRRAHARSSRAARRAGAYQDRFRQALRRHQQLASSPSSPRAIARPSPGPCPATRTSSKRPCACS